MLFSQVTDIGLQDALLFTRCSPTPTTTCSAPDWPNSPTQPGPGHPRCAQPPAPTRQPSTTWPATHTWLP